MAPLISLAQFIRTHGSRAHLLVPPYDGLRPVVEQWRRGSPPLGTIACGSNTELLLVVGELSGVVNEWPWVVPCPILTAPQWGVEDLIELHPEPRARLALAMVRDASSHDSRAVLAAVRRRALPSAELLADWVGRRLGSSALRALLLAPFQRAMGPTAVPGTVSVATLSRHFRRFGRYKARDWRTIARLTVTLCEVTARGETRALGPRTRKHVRTYLQVPAKIATALLGWEWVLEQALRIGGYPIWQRHHHGLGLQPSDRFPKTAISRRTPRSRRRGRPTAVP